MATGRRFGMMASWSPGVCIAALAVSMALPLASCGKGDAAGKAGGTVASSAAGTPLSLDTLASLTNYRSVMVSGMGNTQTTLRTAVHSPTNWQVITPMKTLHIAGEKYLNVGNQWLAHPDRPDSYARQNLPSVARQFFATTHIAHAHIQRGKACRQANVDGHLWSVVADGGAVLQESFVACVADKGGALLKLVVGAGGQAVGQQRAREVYEITAIGDVPAFKVPANVKGG